MVSQGTLKTRRVELEKKNKYNTESGQTASSLRLCQAQNGSTLVRMPGNTALLLVSPVFEAMRALRRALVLAGPISTDREVTSLRFMERASLNDSQSRTSISSME